MSVDIQKIIEGDERAFEKFYLKTHGKLYRFALNRTQDEYLSQEVLQKAYITLWEKRNTITPKIHFFEAYLFKLVRNLIIHEYKRRITEQEAKLHFEAIRQANKEDSQPEDRQKFNIEEILSLLPNQQRRVFELIKLQGLSYSEAAEELNISKRTVESHLRQAVINLRKKLSFK